MGTLFPAAKGKSYERSHDSICAGIGTYPVGWSGTAVPTLRFVKICVVIVVSTLPRVEACNTYCGPNSTLR